MLGRKSDFENGGTTGRNSVTPAVKQPEEQPMTYDRNSPDDDLPF